MGDPNLAACGRKCPHTHPASTLCKALTPKSSPAPLSLPIFMLWSESWPTFRHGERRGGSQARLICRGVGGFAPFIVACVCGMCSLCKCLYSMRLTAHHWPAVCGHVPLVRVLMAKVYLFIYLFLADRCKREAEGRERGERGSSIFRVSLCLTKRQEGDAELVSKQATVQCRDLA